MNSVDTKITFLQCGCVECKKQIVPPVEEGCDDSILWEYEKCEYGR